VDGSEQRHLGARNFDWGFDIAVPGKMSEALGSVVKDCVGVGFGEQESQNY
jgi:hypothetical protein